MRNNTSLVLDSFLDGKAAKKCPAIHTDGTWIYSYNAVIAGPDPLVKGGYVLTLQKFSHTTSIHCNGVNFGLTRAGKNVRMVSQKDLEEYKDGYR